MRFGSIPVFLILLAAPLALTACSPKPGVRVESAPAMPIQMMPTALQEKVVQMVTLTPTFDLALGTPTPYVELPGVRPTPTPFSLSDWGTPVTSYSDRNAGFAFACPVDWNVSPPSEDDRKGSKAYIIALRSTSPVISRIHPDESPRMASVDITVSNDGKQYTLEEAVKLRKEEFAAMDTPWKVTSEGPWTLPSGINVVRFDLDSPIGPVRETVAVIDGRRVLFTGSESLELFDSIAMTLTLE